jgi:hypothetical protein
MQCDVGSEERAAPSRLGGGAVVTFHDPRHEVEKFREQLASHENPIVFLIGAGASCAVRDADGKVLVPAAAPLRELCAEAVAGLGEKPREIYEALATQIQEVRALRQTSKSADLQVRSHNIHYRVMDRPGARRRAPQVRCEGVLKRRHAGEQSKGDSPAARARVVAA